MEEERRGSGERKNGIAKDEEREKRNDKEVWQRRVGKLKRKRVFMPTEEKRGMA